MVCPERVAFRVPDVDIVESVSAVVLFLVCGLALKHLSTTIMECQGGEAPDETRIERVAERVAERFGGAVWRSGVRSRGGGRPYNAHSAGPVTSGRYREDGRTAKEYTNQTIHGYSRTYPKI